MKRKLQAAKEVFSAAKRNKLADHDSPMQVDRTTAETNLQQLRTCEAPTSVTPESSKGVGKFHNKAMADLLFMEIFAGTARLSKVARDHGVNILPVDKTAVRASQVFIANYDLTDPQALEALMELLKSESGRVLSVHLAPACGTASRAREKKLTSFRNRGFKVPGPLRSKSKPLGLDALQGLDKIRTESANQVYSATAAIMKLCIDHNILVSLENPWNSLFWDYPDIDELFRWHSGFGVFFQHCMHGGTRNKKTRWWSSENVFQELEAACDGKHSHATWNPKQVGQQLVFPTAEEAAYPHLLCKRVVAILINYALKHGALQPHTLEQEVPVTTNTAHRWLLDMLPKGKKMKPLVSEFQGYCNFLSEPSQEPEHHPFFKQLPKGARIVHRRLQWGKVRVDEGNFFWVSDNKEVGLDDTIQHKFFPENGEQFLAELCSAGVPREPWDFVEQAFKAGHPRSISLHLNSEITDMLKENFAMPPHLVVKARVEFFPKWSARCKALEADEKKLHDGLAPHLKQVLRGKRLLLLGNAGLVWISRSRPCSGHYKWFSAFRMASKITCVPSGP